VRNWLFSYFHIILILLLSIVFIPPAFAIEARYVKILIDGTTNTAFCSGVISIADLAIIDYLGVDLVASTSVRVSAASVNTLFMFGSFCDANSVPDWAIDFDGSTAYTTPNGSGMYPIGSEWLMIDLGTITNISTVILSTLEGWNGSLMYSPLTDYRIAVSLDGLDWTLAAVVTNESGVARTDTVTLEDLGAGMDIDMNYVLALFLVILVLGFLRQVFF
jgi:hypothetical protein